MTTIKLTLNEAPTDALVYLVDEPAGADRTTLVEAMHPKTDLAIDEVTRKVAHALTLLHDLAFVRTTGGGETPLRWHATDEGRAVVKKARVALTAHTKTTNKD